MRTAAPRDLPALAALARTLAEGLEEPSGTDPELALVNLRLALRDARSRVLVAETVGRGAVLGEGSDPEVGRASGEGAGAALGAGPASYAGSSSGACAAPAASEVAGFVHVTVHRTVLHPGPSGLVEELMVAPGSRRRGAGRSLLEAAVEECRRMGCCEVEVAAERGNSAARRLYRSLGFTERGVLLEMDLEGAGPPRG